MSSASVVTFLLAGYFPTTNSSLQLSCTCRAIESTFPLLLYPLLRSRLLGYLCDRYSAIAYQRPLFTEPLLSNSCFINAYLAVAA
jgi:hypothetical protein